MRTLVFAAAMLSAAVLPAAAQGITCANAVTLVERAICSDPDLLRLDTRMAIAYRNLTASTFGMERQRIVDTQRRFITAREGCSTEACVFQLTRSRARALEVY
jgi:uncharacterized protein